MDPDAVGMVSAVGRGMGVLGGGPRRPTCLKGRVDIGVVCLHWPNGVKGIFLKRCIRRVRAKLRLFLYGQYIVRNVFSLAL